MGVALILNRREAANVLCGRLVVLIIQSNVL